MSYSKKTGLFKGQNGGFSAQIYRVTLKKTGFCKKKKGMLYADIIHVYISRVLQLNVFLCGLFHTLLLAVPKNYNSIVYPTATANIGT